jgi:uncharacterized protein (TIGR02391 family)
MSIQRTYLAKPIAEVSADIEKQIGQGRELQLFLVSMVLMPSQFVEFASKFRTWRDYNQTYLERAFTTDEISTGYHNTGLIGLLPYRASVALQLKQQTDSLQSNLNFLISLKERLSLYEPPRTAAAVEAELSVTAISDSLHELTEDMRARLRNYEEQTTPIAMATRWAAEHQRFLEIIFERFDADSEWPALENLQRLLDRRGEDIDLIATARAIPIELGYFEMGAQRPTLKLRALAFVAAAGPLVESFVRVIELAVERYLDETGTPRITSKDLHELLGFDEQTVRKLGMLLENEPPFIFGGGSGMITDPSWERDLARGIRELRGTNSIESYLDAQERVMSAVATVIPPVIPRRTLRPTAPPLGSCSTDAAPTPDSLPIEDLHPIIQEACSSRFAMKHYADGVHRAAIALRDLVRQRSGLDSLDGTDLMSQALSPKDPVLIVADLTTKTGYSVQLGTMLMAQGAMTAIRNLVAHERLDLDPAEAMSMVATLSLLAHWIERAQRADQ